MDPKGLGIVTPHNTPWFFKKYYSDGNNNRYVSFQLALNILDTVNVSGRPVIVETGCQREENDLGAGMSTSIFAEFIQRHQGRLVVVDNVKTHLNRAKGYVQKQFPKVMDRVQFELSDSVKYLQNSREVFDLVYLDSYDYPYVEMLNRLGRKPDASNQPEIEKKLWDMSESDVFDQFKDIIVPCQDHCMNEFMAVEKKIATAGLLLVDDVSFPGGGKPGMLLDYLCEHDDFIHLYTYQQSLWLKWK